jgi:hypothetical protein
LASRSHSGHGKNLFSLGFEEQSGIAVSDPAIHCALAQAKSLDDRAERLVRLSLYEQRLNRTLAQAHAQLKQLQQERAKAREQALNDAAQIRKSKEALGQPWRPESDGFEFSSADLTAWIERRELLEQAPAPCVGRPIVAAAAFQVAGAETL